MATVEIFSQGEELVTGQTLDTNAGWLSARLVQQGFTISRHTTVGDKLSDLVDLLKEVAERADCCICTGGLGPTVDDLTAEAVAIAFDRPLAFDASAYRQIAAYFQHRSRAMPESNRKQAMLPQASERLDNDWGTAPGFTLQQGRCRFFFVPGVPYEMKQLYQTRILPRLQQQFRVRPGQLIIIKTIGIGESDIQQRLQDLTLPPSVQLSFRTRSVENQTKLLFPPDYPRPELERFSCEVAARIGDPVFTIEGVDRISGDLLAILDALLHKNRLSLALVETLTQGAIASQCTGVDWLIESLYCRDGEQLQRKLSLPKPASDNIDEPAALTLAERIKSLSGADIGLAQLFYSETGNDQDSPSVLFTALTSDHGQRCQKLTISGPRARQQHRAALHALDFIRRFIKDTDHYASD